MSKRSRRRQKNQFDRIISEQGGCCYYCNVPMFRFGEVPDGHPRMATKDHRIPQTHGGSGRRENLVAACFACNNAKDCKPEEEFIKSKRKAA